MAAATIDSLGGETQVQAPETRRIAVVTTTTGRGDGIDQQVFMSSGVRTMAGEATIVLLCWYVRNLLGQLVLDLRVAADAERSRPGSQEALDGAGVRLVTSRAPTVDDRLVGGAAGRRGAGDIVTVATQRPLGRDQQPLDFRAVGKMAEITIAVCIRGMLGSVLQSLRGPLMTLLTKELAWGSNQLLWPGMGGMAGGTVTGGNRGM